MIVLSLLVISTITINAIIVSIQVQEMSESDSQIIAKETSQHYANMVKADIEVALNEARGIADIFETTVNSKKIEMTRESANMTLKSFIEQNKNFLGVYVAFEPGAFNRNDKDFINTEGHDSTGRYIPYWTRDSSGRGVVEPLVSYEVAGDGDYYQIPKKTKIEAIIEPYIYAVQGVDTLITSYMVKILFLPES